MYIPLGASNKSQFSQTSKLKSFDQKENPTCGSLSLSPGREITLVRSHCMYSKTR
jgi:hypothetical protein